MMTQAIGKLPLCMLRKIYTSEEEEILAKTKLLVRLLLRAYCQQLLALGKALGKVSLARVYQG